MSNIRVYEVGEEFFDKDLGCKVRCVADRRNEMGCELCIYAEIPDSCLKAVCCPDSRRQHKDCKNPVYVHFEKVGEDAGNNQ